MEVEFLRSDKQNGTDEMKTMIDQMCQYLANRSYGDTVNYKSETKEKKN